MKIYNELPNYVRTSHIFYKVIFLFHAKCDNISWKGEMKHERIVYPDGTYLKNLRKDTSVKRLECGFAERRDPWIPGAERGRKDYDHQDPDRAA